MTSTIRPLIAGNWKMNGLRASMAEFEAMVAGASEVTGKADLLICPPATLIADSSPGRTPPAKASVTHSSHTWSASCAYARRCPTDKTL